MTSRSIRGVNAEGGSPGSELSSGVVGPRGAAITLVVVRSGLSKHTTSTTFPLRKPSISEHPANAVPGAILQRTPTRAVSRAKLRRVMMTSRLFRDREAGAAAEQETTIELLTPGLFSSPRFARS